MYGPVNSRRLGRSLGINLLPSTYKLCSFDCIYCDYGRTQVKALGAEGRDIPSEDQVLQEVKQALQEVNDIDYLTFSGNGEPTPHPQFPAIVSGVRRLRDTSRPEVKLAVFSNATTAHLPHIQECLSQMDAAIMKLDAGNPLTLARINRPLPAVTLAAILDGLQHPPNLIVQSVFVDGIVANTDGLAFEAWLNALAQVKPTRVQIYSTDRPVAVAGVERVPPDTLQSIAQQITRQTDIPVDAYWARDKGHQS
jgi:wyosine [tRNA(Phe)-imidazoG37] synthetase (radical SAM superfamily)